MKRLKKNPKNFHWHRSKVRILTPYEKGWIEAAIDGEDGLLITETEEKYRLQIYIYNTSLDFLEKAKRIIGHGGIWKHIKPKASEKQCYTYVLHGANNLLMLLSQIQLTIKENKRLLMLQILKKLKEEGTR